jgi:hypothetical protein
MTGEAEDRGDADKRGRAAFGETLDVVDVGRVQVTRRYGCTRRDQFELRTPGPFPEGLRDWLAGRGALRETPALYVLDVPGGYQLTVAPRAGRALFVPRMSTELEWQRSTALEIARAVDGMLSGT